MASSLLKPEIDPPKGGTVQVQKSHGSCISPESNLNLDKLEEVSKASSEEYLGLQRRIFLTTLIVSLFAIVFSTVFFDSQTSISILLGAFSGIVYLRLLARGIGNLGKSKKSVGKIQLLIPVLLVLLVSKIPQLELLPSLLGFLIYKPSLIFQFLLDSQKDL